MTPLLRPTPAMVAEAKDFLEGERQRDIHNNLVLRAQAGQRDVRARLAAEGNGGVARRPTAIERKQLALSLRYTGGGNRNARRQAARNFGR